MTLFLGVSQSWIVRVFGLVLSGLGVILCVCVTSGFCFEVVEFCCCDACMTMAMMM